MSYRKKLIEVALPLEAINKESAREKSIRHGHPSTLHLWWARRPLAACRAVLFASLVDDPSSRPEEFPTEEAQERERDRLFRIIEDLVKWENINNAEVLGAARREILKSTDGNPPPVYDPFCGGGSIPLEAQRLGLEAHGSDLNPVAVLITKALIEIPPKFKDLPPVNPESRSQLKVNQWRGAQGLAEDVRYYGKWMRDRAFEKIGHLYPKVKIAEGQEATVIAWIWARTVKCPNPTCGCQMPLVRAFALSTKKGKETWVEPIVDRSITPPKIQFEVKRKDQQEAKRKQAQTDDEKEQISLTPPDGTVSRKGAVCVACGTPVALEYVRSQGKAGHMEAQMMAIVAEGTRQRVYLSPVEAHEKIVTLIEPEWRSEATLSTHSQYMAAPRYGMTQHGDLFTARQTVSLTVLCDLIDEIHREIKTSLETPLGETNSINIGEYADAVATYLALAIGRSSDFWSSLATWSAQPKNELVAHTFTRQALPITWDFAEANPFSVSGGNFEGNLSFIIKVIQGSISSPNIGRAIQIDATHFETEVISNRPLLISTDPPYYDAVPYADLSDFFYVWLRRSLSNIYPELFSTVLVPKDQELVADQERCGSRMKAQQFFEDGLSRVFSRARASVDSNYPFTVYYAFKQVEVDEETEQNENLTASTGWETMLEGLINSGFVITGTLPVRTERSARTRSIGSNALASSIVLVCRPRPTDAKPTTRRDFLNALKRELPDALKKLQQGNIAPVDLAQASIGPGMAIYSRYAKVLESDGTPLKVRTALQLINQTLDEFLTEQEGEFDPDTRWALAWFEQHQHTDGRFGDAETLSKAKNTSIKGLETAGILSAKSGKVRLLTRDELPQSWNPTRDERSPDWEATQHLIRTLLNQGETAAANLLAQLGNRGDIARDLAYRLYSICDRKGWTTEAIAYNSLVIAWSEISRLAAEVKQSTPVQGSLEF